MPFVEREGVQIHYEMEGDGPPIVMQHGLTLAIDCWRLFGYADTLRKKHRLILIDARGHGASGTPDDLGECTTELMAGDVLAVMDACGVDRAHYCGYSMGGWIGFLLANLAPERFLSMMIGGAHCHADDLSGFRATLAKGMGAWIDLCEASMGALPKELKDHYLALNPKPLEAIVKHDRPDLSGVIGKMKMPCLIWVGARDARAEKARRCATQLARAEFVSLPGLDHIQAFARGDLVLPAITRFLAQAGTTC
jgi:pimeloyl-ACP methyl ester carboxylesterase